MAMSDDLIKQLRYCADATTCRNCLWKTEYCPTDMQKNAADAIEELREAVLRLEDESGIYDEFPTVFIYPTEWIMFESRPMDEEERQYYSEHFGYELADDEAVIYFSKLPEHDQEVLVCNKYGHIWIDRFDDDPDYGIGFETNGDMDGLVAWMPLPEPPKDGE